MGLLDGKIVALSGAARGIGRATAILLAREGATLSLMDNLCEINGESSALTSALASGQTDESSAATQGNLFESLSQELTSLGAKFSIHQKDATSSSDVQQWIAESEQEHGPIDVLINNAGILRDQLVLKVSDEMWNQVIATNLTASFLSTRAVLKSMRSRGGKIINTSAIAGLVGNYGQINYSAATAGIYGLTRSTSIEFQRYGIQVNAVAPLAKTRQTEEMPMFAQISTMTVEHVAPVHLFLASSLSDEVSGSVISVAGGRLSAFKLAESHGVFKDEDNGIWTAQEIADNWELISKV